MFGRIRRLEISLAAKCQILFGAAVLLIIAAALLVPWRRMEQLTAQLDERSAAALADEVMARHMDAEMPAPVTAPASTQPSDESPADLGPDDDEAPKRPGPPEASERKAGPRQPVSRLFGAGRPADLSRFERKAMAYFMRHRETAPMAGYYDRADETDGYHYARPLYLNDHCSRCHTVRADGLLLTAVHPAPASTQPAA